MRHGHHRTDLRHWHLHRVALQKLEQHPEALTKVLALLDGWLEQEDLSSSRIWLEQWRTMLMAWPFEQMKEVVLDFDRGQTLRQCSPLGPVLTPQERWQALANADSGPGIETATGSI